MKIVFFGTPDYVLPVLDLLNKYHEIVAVVTQSPKPVGREKTIEYSAVDKWAYKKDIKILSELDIQKFPQAHLGVCAAFGMIIPQTTLDHFKHGILNIHPSILPKYRGASPIQSAITNLDKTTGVSIIKMDEKMDHGPVLSSFKTDILLTDTFETLSVRLFELASEFLINLIPNYSKGKIKLKPQDETQATYCKIIKKQDGFVDLEKDDPKQIEAKLRAYYPWPGIWTLLRQDSSGQAKRLKVLKCHLENSELVLDKVQLEGKNPVSFKQFIAK
ncbi:MAG: Methionyl-tRNA formyltransferase [Candidatus Woesebacteria bacterium GW2011_GWA1_33_30]|uniref:methionyl-tRNA formyltransferase n=1 Tax=Candidatus Woesebacteria bacterium GW2011_GWA2_33_28 TaxID=1618561 RepID=A0A0G0C9U0_9BACT|nr:MAG: Methionyl-tRNA formyltransferase [Candidatus Woesebacteria bacterium GW2011_GWA2_33_28]KKP48763.1 MAG: Methionyl-tRNA formyltransferase [Candidatus Woesebacteria bacterium GW2011_GWA1_33_30]KKP50036.1 MAG: Methionyl-tRNA formyltransferase [Microgenomates group bacterium GW2011_GWC1_33_32]KKP51807.1 MAG: Methionyl-tRNA formyltransferase [Candidatus Woesebacteria bacterium GW2011_GWB1_33_38]KKP58579.1 MAG: Methionyl-tRNA formyltransferase [Microgenomates group bacterium GW2011_GWD1_33_9]